LGDAHPLCFLGLHFYANEISSKTLMPVHNTSGCCGHLLRWKHFRAFDANGLSSAAGTALIFASAVALFLSNQMMWRHYLVQIKRINKLTSPCSPPTHHEPLPRESLQATESWLSDGLNESFCNTFRSKADIGADIGDA
jgi:hypothetical protein